MAGIYDINIDQGTDLSVLFVLKDDEGKLLNLHGFDCRMQVRRSKGSSKLIDELTLENGRLSLDVEQAQIELSFPNEVTKKYPAMTLVYDFEMVSSENKVARLVEGTINVTAEVTRNDCICNR